jgi:hypothetical protein
VVDPAPANNSATDVDMLVSRTEGFYSLSPCRFLDTRVTTLGGPAPLVGGIARVVQVAGQCSVPSTAKAISINVTATQAGSAGHLTIYPTGLAMPAVSVLNFSPSKTRGNNAIVQLGPTGEVTVYPVMGAGRVDVIMDVAGYFE